MGQVILGGTRYKRYPVPSVSNLPNAQGLYAWSMLYANLYFLDAGAAEKTSGLTDPTPLNLLLFLSDIPGIGQLKCYSFNAVNAHQLTDITNEVSVPFLVTAPAGSSAVTVNIGQVAQGYTGDTGEVRCTGFPARGVADIAGVLGTVDEIAVTVWANGAVMNAPVSQNKDDGSQIVPQPMILRASDYSEVIRASNNVFKDTNDYLWLVVGLYETEPPNIQQGQKG